MNTKVEKVFTKRGFTNIEQMATMFDWNKEEIERLKKELKREQDNSIYLEEKINKAIEYIENHNYPQLDEMDYYSTSELLDILRGEDK